MEIPFQTTQELSRMKELLIFEPEPTYRIDFIETIHFFQMNFNKTYPTEKRN